jgi:DNA-binding CsgD family transcriptional regulator
MIAKSTELLSSTSWDRQREPKNEMELAKRIERFSIRKCRGWVYRHTTKDMRRMVDIDDIVNEGYMIWRVYRIVHYNTPKYMSVVLALRIAKGRLFRRELKFSTLEAHAGRILASKQAHIRRYELAELALSPKQDKVLQLLMAGYAMGEVADLLGVTAGRITAILKRIGEIALADREYVPAIHSYTAPKRLESKKVYPTPNNTRIRKSTLAEREAMREAYPLCYGEIFH